MSSKSTKATLQSLDKAEFLGTSIRTQMPTVSPRLAEVYGTLPPRGGGEGPRGLDWDLIQESNADLLDQDARALREASQIHRVHKAKVVEIRDGRDKLVTSLKGGHRSVRKAVDGAYETGTSGLLGLGAPPDTTVLGFREQCHDAVGFLRDPLLAARLGTLRPGATAPDWGLLAKEMEDGLAEFEAILNDLTQAVKVRDESFLAKEEARKRLNRTYANVARVQEGYYRLVGLDELADRIRITIPVRSSKPGEDEQPREDGPPPSEG